MATKGPARGGTKGPSGATKGPSGAGKPMRAKPRPPINSNLYGSGPELITKAGLVVFARQHRVALADNPGRTLLRIVQDHEGSYTSHADANPDRDSRELGQQKEFEAWRQKCARAKDTALVAFVEGVLDTWGRYDHEELVMCLVNIGYVNQVQLVPKPWIETPHEHCLCGLRIGSDPRHEQEHAETDLVDLAMVTLGEFLLKRHDKEIVQSIMAFTQQVLIHIYGALHSGEETLSHEERIAVYLGGALCCADGLTDVGDPPVLSMLVGSAEKLLDLVVEKSETAQALVAHGTREKIIQSIVRGRLHIDDVPMFGGEDYVQAGIWLESLGAVGIQRFGQYYRDNGLPLSMPDSPYPVTEEEVFRFVTPERRDAYRKTQKSRSLLDHYYDELLHRQDELTRHPNRYIARKAMSRGAAMTKLCLLTRDDAIAGVI
jgi:hypothetical protein